MTADTNRLTRLIRSRVGPGFRMVDEVLEVSWEDGSIKTRFDYLPNDPEKPYLLDHFPGRPVMPFNLLSEMMAQTSALSLGIDDETAVCALVEVSSCRARLEVRPPAQLFIQSVCQWRRGEFFGFKAEVRLPDGRLVAKTDLVLRRQSPPPPGTA